MKKIHCHFATEPPLPKMPIGEDFKQVQIAFGQHADFNLNHTIFGKFLLIGRAVQEDHRGIRHIARGKRRAIRESHIFEIGHLINSDPNVILARLCLIPHKHGLMWASVVTKPDQDCTIITARRQHTTIRRKTYGSHPATMSFQGFENTTRRHVP